MEKTCWAKVFVNKKNGQGLVYLPKKKIKGDLPKKVKIKWLTSNN